jgi:hypothetical protein
MAGIKITPKFSSLTAPEHFELVPQTDYRTLNLDLCASTTKFKKAGQDHGSLGDGPLDWAVSLPMMSPELSIENSTIFLRIRDGV